MLTTILSQIILQNHKSNVHYGQNYYNRSISEVTLKHEMVKLPVLWVGIVPALSKCVAGSQITLCVCVVLVCGMCVCLSVSLSVCASNSQCTELIKLKDYLFLKSLEEIIAIYLFMSILKENRFLCQDSFSLLAFPVRLENS